MGSFLLQFDTSAVFNGGSPIELEVLVGGVVVSSVFLENASESNQLLLDFTGLAPSSLTIRFASGNLGDTVALTSVSVNQAALTPVTDYSTAAVTQGTGISVSAAAELYGYTVPTLDPAELTGSATDDKFLNGDNEADNIDGLAGNDRIRGKGGDDAINGGIGNDTIYGEEGADTILGGSGDDLIFGNDDNDILYGESGNDRLLGGDGDDIINGGTGTDRLSGGNGNDTLFGEDGADRLIGGAGNDLLFGDDGNDVISGGAGDDAIAGGDGDDTVFDGAGNDLISGGDGNDELYASSGDDILSGGAGIDILYGGADMDDLAGGDGDDTFYLSNGDFVAGEIINGGNDTDNITLWNGVTVDFTTGTLSNLETLMGSTDNDDVTLSLDQLNAFTTVDLDGGTDTQRISFSGTMDVSAETLPTVSNVENGFLVGSAGADDLTITGTQINTLIFGSGTIDFAGGSDVLRLTSTSTDLNTLGTTDGSIVGLEEVDLSSAAGSVTITLSGQTEGFTVTTTGSADTITTGSGDDIISSAGGADIITTGAGADNITAGGGSDDITAGTGADIINAGGGADDIFLANGDFAAGESIDGGSNSNDEIILTNATTVDFTTGTLASVEFLSGSANNDDVTIGADQLNGFTTIDLNGGTDVLTVFVDGTVDISGDTLPGTITAETKDISGSTGNDTFTVTGAQLNTILLTGTSTIDFDSGADTLNITSTSTDLNTIGSTDNARITGLETISAASAGADVTIDLSAQTEGFTLTGSGFADTITAGSGADTISAGNGNDTINIASGDVAAGESIDGGANTDTIIATSTGETDFRNGTITNVENLDGISGAQDFRLNLDDTVSFDAIDMIGGGWNQVYSYFSGTLDVTAASATVLSNVNSGHIQGSTGNDTLTISGTELDALWFGTGHLEMLGGNDVLVLTSTSSELNSKGASDNTRIAGIETVDLSSAAGAVTLNLSAQTEGFTVTGSNNGDNITTGSGADNITGGTGADTIITGTGADTINGGNGNDTINLANGDFAAGESINGGGNTDEIVLTNATTVDFTTGTLSNIETLTGSTGNDDVTISGTQLNSFTSIDLGTGTDTLTVTSTSTGLNGLADGAFAGIENVSAGTAAVTIDLSAQTEDLTITGSGNADDLTGGSGTNTIIGGAGADDLRSGSVDEWTAAVNDILTNNAGVVYSSATNSFYQQNTTTQSWTNSNTAASTSTLTGLSNNGYLATVTSQAENDFIFTNWGGTRMWIGGNDATTEGEWVWQSTGSPENGLQFHTGGAAGSALNGHYTNWVAGDPSNGSGTWDYTEYRADGTWWSNADTSNFASVIEWDAAELLATINRTTIEGGTGADTLYGSAGSDIFDFDLTDAMDTVQNFDTTDRDAIDISDLLTGYNYLTSDINDFVQLTESGGNTTLAVDANGATGGASFTNIAQINGVTGVDLYQWIAADNLIIA